MEQSLNKFWPEGRRDCLRFIDKSDSFDLDRLLSVLFLCLCISGLLKPQNYSAISGILTPGKLSTMPA